MKKYLSILIASLILIGFLCSCATYTCLDKALDTAKQIENKDNLIFVEGIVWPDNNHVQLWLYDNDTFKILSGHLFEDKWKFQATEFLSYGTYMARIERYGWNK